MTDSHIINGKIYKETDLYEISIPFNELGDTKLCDLPQKIYVSIPLNKKIDGVEFIFSAKYENTSDGIYNSLGFYFHFKDRSKIKGRMRMKAIKQHFSQIAKKWVTLEFDNGEDDNNNFSSSYYLKKNLIKENKSIVASFNPILSLLQKFRTSRIRAFLCHASEDKSIVEDFAIQLKSNGSLIWFDKWEIKIGDSIVDKINDGLENMTHLIIFFSKNSIKKPWVKKELSSGLFRKLKDNSVQVIPVLLDKISIPAIIADIKYSNCSINRKSGFSELIKSLIK